jgi:hypothetical protein
MQTFLRRFGHLVLGVLNGFDRLFFRGTLRNLASAQGLQNYLWANRIPFKDFAAHSRDVTARLEQASQRQARERGREIRYLNSSSFRKEDVAREIAARDGITEGLVCVLRCVDPCLSFEVHKSRARKRLEILYRERKCIHLYHYQIHPVFGFMHARIQTWFPFRVYVCLNGREWLARQMDHAGLRYVRRDNCFTDVENLARAQALFDEQLQAAWPGLLTQIGRSLNPVHDEIFARYPTQYYWSVEQSEWASDLLFYRRADLEQLYPRLIRHAITTYGAADVLRFLGRRRLADGQVPARFSGEQQSDVKAREEGVRVKHWLNHNSLKLYDKGSVLRAECTINEPTDFKVYRAKENDPEGPKAWLPLRYGVADLHRRAQVSQAANERYLEALAAVTDTTPLRQLAEPLCHPAPEVRKARPAEATPAPPAAAVQDPAAGAALPPDVGAPRRVRPRRVRALNPLSSEDGALLAAVSRPEFLINGLRNRDLRRLLFGSPGTDSEERRRGSVVTRKLRLLRAHHLVQKVPKTHRYVVSENGRKAITALLAARDANADFLTTHTA